MDTNSDCNNTDPAAGMDDTRTVPAYATSINISDAVEPEPMQADLPLQSDPGASASFKDIANIADVNKRNEWYRSHYAEIDGLFAMPAGLHLVPRSPNLTRIMQLCTLYKIKADGRKRARCVLGGHHCSRVATLSTLSHPPSGTPRCAPSLPSPLSMTSRCMAVM
eukprot:6206952-Pleurochrysis_carterae.AAC.1